jgi:hypothetical protein
MKYIKLENNQPKDYTIEQLLIDYSDAVIYENSQMPNEKLLANYNVYPLITESKPIINEDESVEESTPEFRDGEWHQTWSVRKLTETEIQSVIENTKNNLYLDNIDINNEPVGFLANQELQQQRYEICKTCDSFTSLKTCKECGCIMPLKIKITNSECPLKKW